MTRRPILYETKQGVPGQGETYSGVESGSPWNPKEIAEDPRTPFQRDVDALMAEAAENGIYVESYTTELKPDGEWGITVSESPSQIVETTNYPVGIQEEVVVTESSPFGISVKSEEQKTVISAAGTIFDRNAESTKVNQVETGAQSSREHKN